MIVILKPELEACRVLKLIFHMFRTQQVLKRYLSTIWYKWLSTGQATWTAYFERESLVPTRYSLHLIEAAFGVWESKLSPIELRDRQGGELVHEIGSSSEHHIDGGGFVH